MAVVSCQQHDAPPANERLDESLAMEQALTRGDTIRARDIINDIERRASDSLDYYLGVELEARMWFSLSRRDSFDVASAKLSHFIEQTPPTDDPRLHLLQALLATQQGAYWARVMGRPDTAVVFDQQAIGLLLSQHTPRAERLLLNTLVNVADGHQQMGHFDKSIDCYLRAATLVDSLGYDKMEKVKLWMGLAVAYTNMGNFYQSERWWNQCALYVDSMAPKDVFLYLNNRGNDLFLQQRYEESMALFLRLDTFTADKPHLLWEHMFGRVNQAALCLKLGRPDEADTLLEQTERFFQAQPMPAAQYYLTTLRLEQALLKNDLQSAKRISLQDADQPGMPIQQLVTRLEALANYYEATGQETLQARAVLRRADLIHTLQADQIRMQFQASVNAYEHETRMGAKERQLAEQQFATRWATTVAVTAVIIIALLLVISWQWYRTIRLKRRIEQQRIGRLQDNIRKLQIEMARNRITPHFLSNALATPLLAQAEGRPVDLNPLVALLHQGLTLSSQATDTLTQEMDFIDSYVQVMQQGMQFDYRTELQPDVKPDSVRLPSMILQILVENAIKHGLKSLPPTSPRPREIVLKAWNETAQGLTPRTIITITDTGIGLGSSKQNGTKTGLDVIRRTIELFNKQMPHPIHFDLTNLPANPDDQLPQGCRATLSVPHDLNTTE